MTRTFFPRAILAFALAVGAAACGDDDSKPDNGEQNDDKSDAGEPNNGDGDAGGEPEGDISYVAIAQGEGVSYLVQVPALGAGAMSDFTGVEVPGAAVGVSFGDDPYVYVGSNNGPEIVRFEAKKDGLVEDVRISLAAQGTTSTSGYQSNLLLVNKEKAYLIDNSNSQIVIWNPTTMTVTGKIEHASINEAGLRTGISGFPVFAHDKFFIGVGWLNAQTLEVIHGAAVLVIDTTNDTATVVRDPAERCGYSFSVVEGADGIYVGTESYGAAQHALSAATQAPCMVRLDPQTLTFDADYQVALSDLVGGAPAGTLVPGPEIGKAYLRALDEGALGMTIAQWLTGGQGGGPVGNGRVLSSRAAWSWFELTLGDTPSATLLPYAPTSGATLRIDTGAGTLIPEFDNANSRTALREFSGHVYGDIVLDAQGHVRAVTRVVVQP